MCVQELEWCRVNSEVICNKANVLYKKYISSEPFSGRSRCLNFPKLESECKKYNSKIRRGTDWTSLYRNYHNSKESSASTHICIYEFHILFVHLLTIEFSERFKKAFQSILPAWFILCYNLLRALLSLIFALIRVHNMREKDIVQRKA